MAACALYEFAGEIVDNINEENDPKVIQSLANKLQTTYRDIYGIDEGLPIIDGKVDLRKYKRAEVAFRRDLLPRYEGFSLTSPVLYDDVGIMKKIVLTPELLQELVLTTENLVTFNIPLEGGGELKVKPQSFIDNLKGTNRGFYNLLEDIKARKVNEVTAFDFRLGAELRNQKKVLAEIDSKYGDLNTDKDILEAVLSDYGTEAQKEMNRVLERFFEVTDTASSYEIHKGPFQASGGTATYSHVSVNIGGTSSNNLVESLEYMSMIYVHEKTHIATLALLRGNSTFRKQMVSLYNYATKKLGPALVDSEYGLSNVDEFIAEAFSNPEFQQLLNEVPAYGNKQTIWEKIINYISSILGKTIKDFNSDSLLNEVLETVMAEFSKTKLEKRRINGLRRDYQDIFNAVKEDGTINLFEDNTLNRAILQKFASVYDLEIKNDGGKVKFSLGGKKTLNRYDLHLYLNLREAPSIIYSIEEVDSLYNPNSYTASSFIRFAKKNNSSELNNLEDFRDSLGTVIQIPNEDTNFKYYHIDNDPYWRATSFLGLHDNEKQENQLLRNASRLGNIVDEVGKRVFQGDNLKTITHKAVLEKVKEEDPNVLFMSWGAEPITPEEFNKLVDTLVQAKEELIKEGFVKFYTDIVVWDKEDRVAGEIDVVGEKADGSKTVIDLKTRRRGLDGYEERRTGRGFSEKEKHTKQTNLYSNYAERLLKEKFNAPIILMLSANYSETSEIEAAELKEVEGDKLYSIIQLDRRTDFFNFLDTEGEVSKVLEKTINKNRRDYFRFISQLKRAQDPDYFKENVAKQAELLNNKLKNLNETLVQYTNMVKSTKKGKNTKELQELIDRIETELVREIDETAIEEQIYIAEDFFDFAMEELSSLMGQLDNEFVSQDLNTEIDIYTNIMKYRGVFDTAEQLFNDLLQIEAGLLKDAANFEEVTNKYKEFQGILKLADAKIISKLRSIVGSFLKDSYLGSKAELEYKVQFEKEAAQQKMSTQQTKDYVAKKLRSREVQQAILEKYHDEVNDLINNTQYDMLASSYWLLSDPNIDNPFVQLLHTMIMRAKQKLSTRTNEELQKYNQIFEKLNLSRKEIKELIIRDKNNNAFLINKYKIEALEQIRKLRRESRKLKREFQLTEDPEVGEKLNAKNAEIKEWYGKNQIVTSDNQKVLHSKWLDPAYKKLSSRQLEALALFEKIQTRNDEHLIGALKLSTIESHNTWFRVPGVLATSYERITTGNLAGTISKLWSEATQIEKDDQDYGQFVNEKDFKTNVKRVYTGLDGKPILSTPIFFRNRLREKQSTDLFSIYAMELINGIRYDVDREMERKGSLLEDLIKHKDFFKTEGLFKRKVGSIFRGKNSEVVDTIKGEGSVVAKALSKTMKNQVYSLMNEFSVTANIGGKDYDLNRIMGFIASYTAFANMGFNLLGATNNFLIANVSVAVEAAGKEFIEFKDLAKAKEIYYRNYSKILREMSHTVKTNYVDQIMKIFDVQSELNALNNRYERKNFGTRIAKMDSTLFMHSMGEHEIHATLALSILNNIKMINRNGDVLGKDGKPNSKEPASILDTFYMDKNGILQLKEWAKEGTVFTTHDTVNSFAEEGLGTIRALIKDRVIKTQGAYGKDTASALDRFWYGKIVKQFKKHIPPQFLNRFRGTMDLLNKEKRPFYNYNAKHIEEGYYTTLFRLVGQYIKDAKHIVLSNKERGADRWKPISVAEKANIRKAITELSYIVTVLQLGAMAAAAAADADDKEAQWALYSIARVFRRQVTDAGSAYFDPSEAWRLTESPAAAIRQIDNLRSALGYLAPWNWDELDDTYESGYNRGENKALTKWKRVMLMDKMKQFDPKFVKQTYNSMVAKN